MDSPRKRQQAQKEEYARLLNEHKEAVRTEGVLMRKAIDTGSLKDVLKHAIELLDELRTSSLTPKVRVCGGGRECPRSPALSLLHQ